MLCGMWPVAKDVEAPNRQLVVCEAYIIFHIDFFPPQN